MSTESLPSSGVTTPAPWLHEIVESLGAVAISLVLGALAMIATGHDPVHAYAELLRKVVLRPVGIEASLVHATPLLIVSVSILLTSKTGLWNIGVDGQVLAGAIAAALVAHATSTMPTALIWSISAIAAAVAGGLWILVPAYLRSRSGINEVVTTIMFNYLALYLGAWLVKGPLRDTSLVSPQLPSIPRAERLPTLGDARVHLGLVVAVALVGLVWWWLRYTQGGFEAQIVGENPRVARHALVPVGRVIFGVLIVGGAIAGLAGANDVLATRGTVQAEWAPGYGFAGYALVFLARRRPLLLLPAGMFLGMLAYGQDVMPRAADIPAAFFPMLEGIILICLAITHWRPGWIWGRFQ